MKTLAKLSLIGIILLLTSCATSLSPIEVSNTLPSLTKSKYISQTEVEEFTKTDKCKILVANRSYVAPIGFTAKDDLANAARGIDEWVALDKGNAYVLKNFRWITVDHAGSTQLHIEFDTFLCEE